MVSGLGAATQSRDCDAYPPPLAEPAPLQISELGEAASSPKRPEPSPATTSVRSGSQCTKEPGTLRSVLARAAALLRRSQAVAAKSDNGDAILQINSGSLKW